MSAGTFPNVATQFTAGHGSANPGGRMKPGGRAARRKARALIEQKVLLEIIAGGKPPEPFGGDAVALLQRCYKDETLPLELRLSCASVAARYEARASDDGTGLGDRLAERLLSAEQRDLRIAELNRELGYVADVPSVEPEPQPVEKPPVLQITDGSSHKLPPMAELRAEQARLLEERRWLRAQMRAEYVRRGWAADEFDDR